MNKLNIVTAGLPLASENKGYKRGLEIIKEMGLDGLEVEFVHGVRMNEETQNFVKKYTRENNLAVTCHAPFYINLNSKEEEKIEASVQRILETARVGQNIGAYSITFHAAFYMGKSEEEVYKTVYNSMERITSILESENNNIWIRPETTGKGTQWGTFEEIVELSKNFKTVLPCIDFSHIHARYNGIYNTYDEFAQILDYMGTNLGSEVFNDFHAHLAGIEYGLKGEKNHLVLEESDMNYKDLLKAFKDFNVNGVLVCESPNIEIDTKILKDFYMSI